MTDKDVQFVVHGPPGSAPPVLAQAFMKAVAQSGCDSRPWDIIDRGNDPGVDALAYLMEHAGEDNVMSTCTPVFIQAPIIRGMPVSVRDTTPLARLVSDTFFLVVDTARGLRSIEDVVAAMRGRKTRSAGYFLGGINHLLALALTQAVGAELDFTVVPDEPTVWRNLVAGRIDWGCGVIAEIQPYLESGELTVIGAFSPNRSPRMPDVPTFSEAGLPVTFSMWRGIVGPPGLSAEQCARWDTIIRSAIGTPAWQAYLEDNGQADAFLPSEQFRHFLQQEWDWYDHHLKLAGVVK